AAARRRQAGHGYGVSLPGREPRRLPLVGVPAARHSPLLASGLADHWAARHRPHLWLPHDGEARHRAVRARLPTRLPGGRGDSLDARSPPAELRDPGLDARATDGRGLDL